MPSKRGSSTNAKRDPYVRFKLFHRFWLNLDGTFKTMYTQAAIERFEACYNSEIKKTEK